MAGLWSNMSSESNAVSPFVSSFLKIMSLLKTSKRPLDPSQFLRFLNQIVHRAGNLDFDLFQQQDAAEILGYILEEFCSECVQSRNLVSISIRQTVTCSSCHQTTLTEDSLPIIYLPVDKSIQGALNSFLRSDVLENFFCNFCGKHQQA